MIIHLMEKELLPRNNGWGWDRIGMSWSWERLESDKPLGRRRNGDIPKF